MDCYRKNTYSGRCINFFSNYRIQHEITILKILIDTSFHKSNIGFIRDILLLNNYPREFVPSYINDKIKTLKDPLLEQPN